MDRRDTPWILIVDDVETYRFVLRNIITDMGLQPILAENGVQALQRVLVIEAVARLRRGAGAQQADAIIVPQGAHTQVGNAAHFADGHHGSSLLSCP